MSSKELYLLRLKKMQATVHAIRTVPKSVFEKISLASTSDTKIKKEASCPF